MLSLKVENTFYSDKFTSGFIMEVKKAEGAFSTCLLVIRYTAGTCLKACRFSTSRAATLLPIPAIHGSVKCINRSCSSLIRGSVIVSFMCSIDCLVFSARRWAIKGSTSP